MSRRDGKAGGGPGTVREDRAERLARALRENLRRRKGQARARRGGEADAPEPPASGDEAGGTPPRGGQD